MSEATGRRADVELRVPADSAYVSVLRTTAAGLAARLDFTLDDVEDLRMAVSEAAAIVLETARPGTDLTMRLWVDPGAVVAAVAVAEADGDGVDEDGFAWQVLTTLASDAAVLSAEGGLELELTVRATPLEAGERH